MIVCGSPVRAQRARSTAVPAPPRAGSESQITSWRTGAHRLRLPSTARPIARWLA